MRRTEETKTGIGWTYKKVPGDLDFADDTCLLNSSVEEMQTKINYLSSNANKVGHFINVSKTEVMRANRDRKSLLLNDKELADVDHFTYLGCVMSKYGNCSINIKNTLERPGGAFKKTQLRPKRPIQMRAEVICACGLKSYMRAGCGHLCVQAAAICACGLRPSMRAGCGHLCLGAEVIYAIGLRSSMRAAAVIYACRLR